MNRQLTARWLVRLARELAAGSKEYTTKDGDTVDQEDVYAWLEAVRESGKINMFGAGRYLEKEFDLDRREAKRALADWMRDF